MALCTSTPKCKLIEEKVNLMSLDSDEDLSSGYDSVYSSDRDIRRSCQRNLRLPPPSDDSDFSSGESTKLDDSSSSSEDDDDSDDLDDIESTESMKVTSTHTLIDNIKYILSMPDLCDVMFIVGQQRIPVYGLKAILSTRSRAFFVMFLKHSKEAMKDKKKSKKSKNVSLEKNNRMSIIIDNYEADVFRSFLLFVHCGSVVLEVTNVTGLLCLATEFDIPDLRSACWDFIEKSMTLAANASILIKDTFQYGENKTAQKMRLQILRLPAKPNKSASISSENTTLTSLSKSRKHYASIETLV